MKKIIFATFFILSCIQGAVQAQAQSSAVLSGTVVDATENRALPGAVLTLSGKTRYTYSDRSGHYEFLNVPAGEYTLTVEYLGYKTSSRSVVVKGGNTQADFSMEENEQSAGAVIVLGDQSRSQAKALNTQRTNDRVTNVISSDQIGRFPDSNIGDALKRVPGIAMQGDQGEARTIVIRGLAPYLNSVTLNGNRIPSAEGDNRNVQMDLIPADMVQTVEVSKTLTADMDADAIGGSVNLITRTAPIDRRISLTGLGGFNPIRNKPTYGGSLVYADRFFGDKLGVVLNGSYHNKEYGSDNAEGVWDKDDNGNVYMSEMDIRKYTVQRTRRSVGVNADWKINASNTITADIMYNWRDDLENRFRLNTEAEPEYDDNGKVTGYIGTVKRENKSGTGRNDKHPGRLEKQTVQSYALGGTHLVSPKFDLTWNINFARAVEKKDGERYIAFQQEDVKIVPDMSVSDRPLISSAAATDYSAFKFDELTENNDFTSEDELAARIDARTPLSVIAGQKGRLRFGVRARLKDKERENDFGKYKPIGEFPGLAQQSVDHSEAMSIDDRYTPGKFFNPEYLGTLDLSDESKFKFKDKPGEYLSKNYKANERVMAAYLRWDQNFSEKLVMTAGVRAEHTYIEYNGNRLVDEESAVADKRDNDYLNILPSLSFKYDLRDNLILRAAFTTSLSRPNYYDLVPFANINSEDREIEKGNPDLKPTYAYNVDVMGEYYFKSVGIFSVGGFYKNLQDFIYTYADNSYNASKFAADFPGMSNPVAANEKWDYRTPLNGKSVSLYGFEVAYQRKLDFFGSAFMRGFGVYANYTYTASETKGVYSGDGDERKGLKLPGSAPHMFNASLSWENQRFSARVSLNYAGSYIDEVGGEAFEDRYYDKQTFLDANASYRIGRYMRVFAEANNLLNTPLRYYQGGVHNRLAQMEYYKPTYTLGVKFDF